MTDFDAPQRMPHETRVETGFAWFLRIVASYCLLMGVLYWIRLIRFYDGPLWRFDLMPLHWQITAAALAVLFPLAASGLWMLASWGPVIWFICAATETIMYAGFPGLFGSRPVVPAVHVFVALCYMVFRIVIFRGKRSEEGSETPRLASLMNMARNLAGLARNLVGLARNLVGLARNLRWPVSR